MEFFLAGAALLLGLTLLRLRLVASAPRPKPAAQPPASRSEYPSYPRLLMQVLLVVAGYVLLSLLLAGMLALLIPVLP